MKFLSIAVFDGVLSEKAIFALHKQMQYATGHATEEVAMNACIDAMRLTTRPGGRPSRLAVRILAKAWGLPSQVVKDALTSDYGIWASRCGKMPVVIRDLREAW